jgi:hypothetical protein
VEWVQLITETIKAGAFEQSTRRVFQTGSWLQKKLMLLIPKELMAKRYKHLELSKEKCNKYLSPDSLSSTNSYIDLDASMKAFAARTGTSFIIFSARMRRAQSAETRLSLTVPYLSSLAPKPLRHFLQV